MNNKNLTEQFTRIFGLLHRVQTHQFHAFGPMGNPHRGQGRVLSLLKMQPEISQKELGYLLDMRNQSLGELLSKLEKNGFITRTPSESDRRTMNIKLTESGVEAANKTNKKQEDVNPLFECLNEEEQIKLGEYLERLIKTLETQLENTDIPVDQRCSSFWGHPRVQERMAMHRSHGRPPHHPHGPHDGCHGKNGRGRHSSGGDHACPDISEES